MYLNELKSRLHRSALLLVVVCLHLLMFSFSLKTGPSSPAPQIRNARELVFLYVNPASKSSSSAPPQLRSLVAPTAISSRRSPDSTQHLPAVVAKSNPAAQTRQLPMTIEQSQNKAENKTQTELTDEFKNHSLNRDVKTLTQNLEREWAQDERKQQAAKPPNQLVREYWEKQNNPYKDKWDALANKIEKAGVARGPQEESYTLDDGSRITKINGICYKAPDPGRSYLAQAEVRQVFCPRH